MLPVAIAPSNRIPGPPGDLHRAKRRATDSNAEFTQLSSHSVLYDVPVRVICDTSMPPLHLGECECKPVVLRD